jgi:hypothetical protein
MACTASNDELIHKIKVFHQANLESLTKPNGNDIDDILLPSRSIPCQNPCIKGILAVDIHHRGTIFEELPEVHVQGTKQMELISRANSSEYHCPPVAFSMSRKKSKTWLTFLSFLPIAAAAATATVGDLNASRCYLTVLNK